MLLSNEKNNLLKRDVVIEGILTGKKAFDKYDVPFSTSFMLLLIGKEGGVKLRSDTILQPKTLFGIIGAMPIPKAEKKQ